MKTIKKHPAVEECNTGESSGVDDYKYEVWLKDGYVFERGRMAGCRGGHFNTIADFNHANPIKNVN